MTVITPEQPEWNLTLPMIRNPVKGESLVGFMLRVDAANGFDAGSTLRAVRRHRSGPSILGQPGDLLSGVSFDLGKLAELNGLTVQAIEALTLGRLRVWLPSHKAARASALAQKAAFAFCPECARAAFIPVIALFRDVSGCDVHGVELVGDCRCGSPILPFASQTPFACHEVGCGRMYKDLAAHDMTAARRRDVTRWSTIYRDLLAAAELGLPPVNGAELARACLSLVSFRGRSAISKVLQRRLAAHGHPSLRTVARTLFEAEASVADLVATVAALPTEDMAPQVIDRDRCPNSRCTGGRLWKNGHVSGHEGWVCSGCGTSFADGRIFFAFDEQPRYASWRARRNAARLPKFRRRAFEVARKLRSRGATVTRDAVFVAAGIPTSAPYTSDRAGLMKIVRSFGQSAGEPPREARG